MVHRTGKKGAQGRKDRDKQYELAIEFCTEKYCSAQVAINTGMFPLVKVQSLQRRMRGAVQNGVNTKSLLTPVEEEEVVTWYYGPVLWEGEKVSTYGIVTVNECGVQNEHSLNARYKVLINELEHRGVPFPVVELTDNHASRYSEMVMITAEGGGIRQFSEKPNSSGFLQALDQINRKFHVEFAKGERELKHARRAEFQALAHRTDPDRVVDISEVKLNMTDAFTIISMIWFCWCTVMDRITAFRKVGITQAMRDPSLVNRSSFVFSPPAPPPKLVTPPLVEELPSLEVRKGSLQYFKLKYYDARNLANEWQTFETTPFQQGLLEPMVMPAPPPKPGRLEEQPGSFLINAVEEPVVQPRSSFPHFDTDNDGTISETEFLQVSALIQTLGSQACGGIAHNFRAGNLPPSILDVLPPDLEVPVDDSRCKDARCPVGGMSSRNVTSLLSGHLELFEAVNDCSVGTITLTTDVSLTNESQLCPISRALVIQGACEPLRCSISASDSFRIFEVAVGGNLTVRNLTLTRGHAQLSTDSQGGGAICVDSKAVVTVYDSEISNCTSVTTGGGIYSLGSISLMRSELLNNTATKDGAGLFSQAGDIIRCRFEDNSALVAYGGGLGILGELGFDQSSNRSLVVDCAFLRNHAQADGGGMGYWIRGLWTRVFTVVAAGRAVDEGVYGGGSWENVGEECLRWWWLGRASDEAFTVVVAGRAVDGVTVVVAGRAVDEDVYSGGGWEGCGRGC
ncbi:hypothetical protein CYMTET_33894 [Cymbomonas tetramitiformis]|uniref:EF-hand domain-containing protein n=1 Tax=Cymbomonas tetramitiformis TaxID=36881 RepID=A0AAE0FC92_9CHLO|nr:hypothetical protein CYMTET_33894 [Cymbomonas tetramitiformis]